MNSEGGSWQRQGKKGRVWVPDTDGGEVAPATVATVAKRKPAAKRARKAKG